jgi:hypothetical protein
MAVVVTSRAPAVRRCHRAPLRRFAAAGAEVLCRQAWLTLGSMAFWSTLAILVQMTVAGAAALPTPTVNLSLYRISPLTYPGVMNMDTGDPGGDIGFGLWEIAMPMGCREPHHMNIGCANGTGDYIHPGDPTNVYEKFTVEANPLFGLYKNCNPDPKYLPNGDPNPTAGVFDCDSMDGFDSAHCVCKGKNASQASFEQYYSDCLNGTVYKHVSANLTQCEVQCAADNVCAAVVMQDGEDGSSCNLLKQPLIQWDDGRDKSHGNCTAAIKKESSNDVKSDNCACYRFNHEAVGKQSQGSGLVPGMPCSAFNTSSMCEDNYDSRCTWKPACCAWDGQSWSCDQCTNVTRNDRLHGTCPLNKSLFACHLSFSHLRQ